MSMRARGSNRGTRGDRATWLVLLALALGVVVPAVSVVWLMTEAVRNQTDAARQRLSDALQGQLRLLGDRIDTEWRSRIARLRNEAGGDAPAFHRLVTGGTLDSIVFPASDGSAGYPTILPPLTLPDDLEHRTDWRLASALERSGSYAAAAAEYAGIAARERHPDRAARAAQAHVRALVEARDAGAALRAIDGYSSTPRFATGRDRDGRLIAADAQLLTLRLAPLPDARGREAARRLAALLNDYQGAPMPSTQRLFLMREVLASGGPGIALPTYDAERLAAEFLQRDAVAPAGDLLEATRLPDVWKLAAGSRAIALFRTSTLTTIASGVLATQNGAGGARFLLLPPGRDGGVETIAASPLLPGWRIAVSLGGGDRVDAAAGPGTVTYLWAGSLTVGALAIAGLLAWQAYRRQLRVTRLKTDLVAAVSHELRTPLASMRALVDLMLETPDLDRRKADEYLQMIAGENARLSRLIEHFLTFSRVDRNGYGLVFRDVSASAVVRQAVEAAAGRDRFQGLLVEMAAELPPLYGDEHALETVVLNLIENAHKYTGEHKRIVVRARAEAGCVVMEVEDNGIGIARRDLKRIFRPFYQVDQRLARERGGCGLGLSIVEFIVRAHGGQVTVQSEPGAGSVFRVILPARAAAGREAVA